MKKAWQTTEFWAMLITNLVGIAVLFGAINVDQGEEIGNALKAIAGAVITIATTLGYMKSRVEVKRARMEALSDYNIGIEKTDSAEMVEVKHKARVMAMKELGV